jgi:hypothetical protein
VALLLLSIGRTKVLFRESPGHAGRRCALPRAGTAVRCRGWTV